jgi:hypothetical protein
MSKCTFGQTDRQVQQLLNLRNIKMTAQLLQQCKNVSIAIGLCGSLIIPSVVYAQSTSFPQVKGKNCPKGFTQSGGTCTDKKGEKEGMVKSGSCPKGFTDTGAYCYRQIKK